MIGGCIADGKYNMTAGHYKKTTAPSSKTGQVKALYCYNGEFELIARGLANLRGKDSGTMQDWGNKLNDYHYLRIKTMAKLEEGDIVAGILDANGFAYGDEQFIILGITPTFDPFGSFIEYDIICNKAEVMVALDKNFVCVPSTDEVSVGATEVGVVV